MLKPAVPALCPPAGEQAPPSTGWPELSRHLGAGVGVPPPPVGPPSNATAGSVTPIAITHSRSAIDIMLEVQGLPVVGVQGLVAER